LPTSKATFPLRAEYLEQIHDEGIALAFPGIEPVPKNDVLDRNLLHSAAEQPFQGGFGVEFFYPTIYDKAACMFFSIAGGHIFGNGNKRTAVLALDQFTAANSIYLLLSNKQIYDLALHTATYNKRNEDPSDVKARISKLIQKNSVEFRKLKRTHRTLWSRLHRLRKLIRHSNQ
jgi:prophage maintenance system killer protein